MKTIFSDLKLRFSYKSTSAIVYDLHQFKPPPIFPLLKIIVYVNDLTLEPITGVQMFALVLLEVIMFFGLLVCASCSCGCPYVFDGCCLSLPFVFVNVLALFGVCSCLLFVVVNVLMRSCVFPSLCFLLL